MLSVPRMAAAVVGVRFADEIRGPSCQKTSSVCPASLICHRDCALIVADGALAASHTTDNWNISRRYLVLLVGLDSNLDDTSRHRMND